VASAAWGLGMFLLLIGLFRELIRRAAAAGID
jgi:hypothetical protein